MISVLGAGVAGLCAATELHRAGLEVEVVAPAHHRPPVSRMAGGMLAPYCEAEGAPPVVVQRGVNAASWWEKHVRQVHRRGTLVVAPARDAQELDRFARATTHHEWVDPGEIEPHLAGRFSRGLFFGDEAHVNPGAALDDLRSHLMTHEVAFRDSPTSKRLVDCRGISARDMLPDLRPVRGEMLTMKTCDVTLSRPIRLLHPRIKCYIVPRGEGVYMVGATMVETNNEGSITGRATMELLSAAYTVHPGFADAEVVETASGLRPAFTDNVPGLKHHNGVWHLNGLYRHGFLLAPALAEDLAQIFTKELTNVSRIERQHRRDKPPNAGSLTVRTSL